MPTSLALVFFESECRLLIILSLSPTIKVNHLKEERRRRRKEEFSRISPPSPSPSPSSSFFKKKR